MPPKKGKKNPPKRNSNFKDQSALLKKMLDENLLFIDEQIKLEESKNENELREKLASRGLSTAGSKEVLVRRLVGSTDDIERHKRIHGLPSNWMPPPNNNVAAPETPGAAFKYSFFEEEAPDMEVVAISRVYHVDLMKEDLHIDISEIKMHHFGTMSATKAPLTGYIKGYEWSLQPLLCPHPYTDVHFYSNDILQVFFYRNENIVGLIFDYSYEEDANKSLILKLAPASESTYNGTMDELQVFLNLCFKMRPDLEPIELSNLSRIRKFLKDPANDLINAEDICSKISEECPAKISHSPQYYGELMRSYLRPYVYFMLENHHLDKKAIKKKISSVHNVPEFMKSLSWTSEVTLYNSLCAYLARHSCLNPECDRFSLLRCGGCDVDSYCNVECQEKGSKIHNCQMSKDYKSRRDVVPNMIQLRLEKCLGKKVCISLHSFSKSLMTRIYRSFHGALQNEHFLIHIQKHFIGRNIRGQRKSSERMLDLVKKGRDTQSIDTIRTQLEQAYGQDSIIVKMMEPSCNCNVTHLSASV